jgi:flagellin FlaB
VFNAESKGVNVMFNWKRLHKNERGQAALETAIILIAFVVVAAVFAFTILSAGNASTDKGKAAISAGMQSVESTMSIKGAVIAKGDADQATKVASVRFTVSIANTGTSILTKDITASYRDAKNLETLKSDDVKYYKADDGSDAGDTLAAGTQYDVEVTIPSSVTLAGSSQFTIELKPPVGAVLQVTRTTPAALVKVMDLQ